MADQFKLRSMEQAIKEKYGSSDDGLEDIFGLNALGPTPKSTQRFTLQSTPGWERSFGQTQTGLPPEVMQELIASGAVKPPQFSNTQDASIPLGTTNELQYNPQLSLGDPGTTTPPSGHWSEQEPQPDVFKPTEYPTTPPDPAESRGLLQQILQNPNIQRAITTGVAGLGAGPYGALAAGQQFEAGEAQRLKQRQVEKEEAFEQKKLDLARKRHETERETLFYKRQEGIEGKDELAFARLARNQLNTGKVKDIKDLEIPESLANRLGIKAIPLYAEQAYIYKESLKGERQASEAKGLTILAKFIDKYPHEEPPTWMITGAGLTSWPRTVDPNARIEWPVPAPIRATFGLDEKIMVTRSEQMSYITNHVNIQKVLAVGEPKRQDILTAATNIANARYEAREKLVQAQAQIGGELQGPPDADGKATRLESMTDAEYNELIVQNMHKLARYSGYRGDLPSLARTPTQQPLNLSVEGVYRSISQMQNPEDQAAALALLDLTPEVRAEVEVRLKSGNVIEEIKQLSISGKQLHKNKLSRWKQAGTGKEPWVNPAPELQSPMALSITSAWVQNLIDEDKAIDLYASETVEGESFELARRLKKQNIDPIAYNTMVQQIRGLQGVDPNYTPSEKMKEKLIYGMDELPWENEPSLFR